MDNQCQNEDDASVVSGDSTTVYTPTHTTEQYIASLVDLSDARDSLGSAPSPGRTYMICRRGSGKMLSLENGCLKLRSAPQVGHHWNCIQNLGWFGFAEAASGGFLGRNGSYGFRASAKQHLPWEWFVVTHYGNEGYHLQSPHFLSLRWVGIGEDDETLKDVTSIAHAALWEFIEV